MRYMKIIDPIMAVVTTLLVVLIITILVTQFNTAPRFFLVMAGLIIGIEIQKRMDGHLIKIQEELINSYKKCLDEIMAMINKVDEDMKKKVEEAKAADLAKTKKPSKKTN